MDLFNIKKPDPTEDSGAFIGGAICVGVFMMLLIGFSKIAPPDRPSHPDKVLTLQVEQSSISR
jgi:hypothetical protein